MSDSDQTTATASQPPPDDGAGAPAEDAPARGRAKGRGQRLGGIVLVFFIACLALTPFVVHNIRTYRAVNPIDEVSYIDYLSKVDHGHLIVGEGEFDDSTVDHAVQCRGVGNSLLGFVSYQIKPDPAACAGAPHHPYSIRDGADIDPPTYYWLTDLGVKVIRGVGISSDFVQAGRLTGIFWGGLSLTLLFFLARVLGARRWPAALVCAVVLLTPGIDEYWSYITPHSTDVAVGAVAAIVAVQWRRRRLPTWALIPAGLLTVIVEGSDLTAGVLLVLFTLVSAYVVLMQPNGRTAAQRPEVVRLLLGTVASAAGIVLGTVGWLAVRKHYALTSVPAFDTAFHVPHFQFHYLVDQIGVFAEPYQNTVGYAVTLWVLGSVVLYATRATRQPSPEGTRQSLAVALIPMVAFGACLFAISDYATEHQYHPILNRYGLALVPMTYAFAALNLRSRWVQAATILVIALLGYIIANPAA